MKVRRERYKGDKKIRYLGYIIGTEKQRHGKTYIL